MKINKPELAHYIIGGLALIFITPPLMKMFPVQEQTLWLNYFFQMNFWMFATAWILAYIIIDQFLHVVVKGEKINIIQ